MNLWRRLKNSGDSTVNASHELEGGERYGQNFNIYTQANTQCGMGLATVHLHWLNSQCLFGELCLSAIDSILKVLYDACWIIGAEDGRSSDNDITA